MFFHFFLGVLYFLFFIFLNKKTGFFLRTNLSIRVINILFALKVVFGLLNVFLVYFYQVDYDLKTLFSNSLTETNLILQHPLKFFTSAFEFNLKNEYGNFFYANSIWDSIRATVLEKFVGLLNIFSYKNAYINSLLYNYLIFWGQMALYKTFTMVWRDNTLAKILGCFFIPSSLFYLSSINKDSLFFLGLCLVIYCCCCIVYLNKKSVSIYLALLLGLLITLFIRNFFFLIFIPTVFAFILSVKNKFNPYWVFATITLIVAIIFFNTPQLMNIACKRQADFLQLNYAKSAITVTTLQPNFKSFLFHFPTAINIAFFRPYIWDSYSFLYFASALEMLTIQILLLFIIILKIKNKIVLPKNAIISFCLFYGLIALLFIGFTIPILGAVTRYRTAFLPLFVTPFLCILPLQKYKWYSYLKSKKNFN